MTMVSPSSTDHAAVGREPARRFSVRSFASSSRWIGPNARPSARSPGTSARRVPTRRVLAEQGVDDALLERRQVGRVEQLDAERGVVEVVGVIEQAQLLAHGQIDDLRRERRLRPPDQVRREHDVQILRRRVLRNDDVARPRLGGV